MYIFIEIILGLIFVLLVGKIYNKRFSSPLLGDFDLMILKSIATYYPDLNVGDKFSHLKYNIVLIGIIASIFKIISLFVNSRIVLYILLGILVFDFSSSYLLYKQRKDILDKELIGHPEQQDAVRPIIKSNQIVLIYKFIACILFLL